MIRLPSGLGMLLLAIFLIVWGILQFGLINVQAFDLSKVVAAIAIAAGILLLLKK